MFLALSSKKSWIRRQIDKKDIVEVWVRKNENVVAVENSDRDRNRNHTLESDKTFETLLGHLKIIHRLYCY